MDVAAFLTEIKSQPRYAQQLVHVQELPERGGRFADPERPLPAALQQLLAQQGIEQLYEHQAQAIDAARARKDLVVVSGTASGKTLCYNLPILETCLADPAGTCPLSLSDQGAGPRPAQRSTRLDRAPAARRPTDSARRL